MTDRIIGVDISKACLDVFTLPEGRYRQFANTTAGHREFLKSCCMEPVSRIVFEPTGSFHRAFEHAIQMAGLPASKVNPLQARRFAEADGTRAKTDKVDARALARMGRALDLPILTEICETTRILKELQVARQGLIKDRTRALNRQKHQTHPLLKRQTQVRIRQIRTQIETLDAEIKRLLDADPELARQRDILCSIPGLSDVSAAAILIELPEIGTLARKKVASLAGLAPMTRQSGQWKGKAFIKGGRKHLRDALYMPALVASRFNPDLKTKYNKLRDDGKPPKLALTALMRKLVELANTLIKADRKWTPKTP